MQITPQVIPILDSLLYFFDLRNPIPIIIMLIGTKMYVNNPVKSCITCEILGSTNPLLQPLLQGNIPTTIVAMNYTNYCG